MTTLSSRGLRQQQFKEQMQAITKIAQMAGGMSTAMPSNGAPQGNMQPMPVG
jgi:hypothetical protein